MLAAVSGKVESIIPFVSKYCITYICLSIFVSTPIHYIYQFVREDKLHVY